MTENQLYSSAAAVASPGITTSQMYDAFCVWAEESGVLGVHRPQLSKLKSQIVELGYRVGHCNKGTAVYSLRLSRKWLFGAVERYPFRGLCDLSTSVAGQHPAQEAADDWMARVFFAGDGSDGLDR